jgi:hypothetical protein
VRLVSALLLFAGAALAGCNSSQPGKAPPRYRLEGSLGQVMDLGYDEARIRQTDQDVSVLFVRIFELDETTSDGGTSNAVGTIEDYPFKLTLALRGQPLPVGVNIDLTEEDDTMNQRGTCSRNVRNDPRKTFPRAKRGELFLERDLVSEMGVVADYVAGNFHVTFENGIEAASGRTVFGHFNARVDQP